MRALFFFAIFSFACHFYRHVLFGVDRVPIVRHILFGGERKMLHLHFRTRQYKPDLIFYYMWVIKFWTVLVLATNIYVLIVLFCGIAVTVHWFFLSFQISVHIRTTFVPMHTHMRLKPSNIHQNHSNALLVHRTQIQWRKQRRKENSLWWPDHETVCVHCCFIGIHKIPTNAHIIQLSCIEHIEWLDVTRLDQTVQRK